MNAGNAQSGKKLIEFYLSLLNLGQRKEADSDQEYYQETKGVIRLNQGAQKMLGNFL